MALVGFCLKPPGGVGMGHVQRLVQELDAAAVVGEMAELWEAIRRVVFAGGEPTPAAVAARMPAEAWPYRRIAEIAKSQEHHARDAGSPEGARVLAETMAEHLIALQRRRELAAEIYTAWLAVTAEGMEAATPYVERAAALSRSMGSLGDLPTLGHLAEQAYMQAAKVVEDRAAGIPPDLLETGLETLDRRSGGFERGDLWVLAGQTSLGKTSAAIQIARSVASPTPLRPRTVDIVSAEMRALQIGQKVLAGQGLMTPAVLRMGEISPPELDRLLEAVGRLAALPVYIDDQSRTLWQVRSRARGLKARTGRLDLLVVDYLQLLDPEVPTENRQQEVTAISRGLKAMAKELDVPVLALSQFSRSSQNRAVPELRDLRESGAIEQDADYVVFLHDPSKVDAATPAPAPDPTALQRRQVIVAKARMGPTFAFECAWDPIRQELEDHATIARRRAAALARRSTPREKADSEPDETAPAAAAAAGLQT